MDGTTLVIPSELFATAESSSFNGTIDLGEFKTGPDTYVFHKPLEWFVQVTNTSGALLVMGNVHGVGTTECARCLEDYQVEVNGEIEGFFVIDPESSEEEPDEEFEEEEFDVLGPNNTIDLVPLIEAAIIVDLPLLPLCKEDCAGICQDCGANLNEGGCNCAEVRKAEWEKAEAQSNPFAVLAQLKFDDED